MSKLKTRDLLGVEILSTGGPIHGAGSPPEGDFWTADDLRAMAAADEELGDELKPPAKIGHSDLQALVRNSGDDLGLTITPGEMPAVGWLENVRVNDDGSKLLADILAVPEKLAELIEAGAWRPRSVELSRITSQVTGKVYDWVVTGLAWLGGKLPAVTTLDDVVALYADHGVALAYQADGAVELRWISSYAAGDIVWSPTDGYEALRAAVSEALNGPGGGDIEQRFWVRDVADGRALVEDWENYDSREAWIVPFTRADDGTVQIAERGSWTAAEMGWLESSKAYGERMLAASAARSRPPADSRPVSVSYTDEQRRTFAEATGLEPDKVTDELLAAAGVAGETPEPEPEPEPTRDLEAVELRRELTEVKADVAEAREEARVERRASFVESALRDGRITPGAAAKLEKLYDKDSEAAREFVAELPRNDDLGREYGSGAEGDDPTDEERDRSYAADASQRLGIPVEAIV